MAQRARIVQNGTRARPPRTVDLFLTDRSSLLSSPVIVRNARFDQKWYNLFNKHAQLNIRLTPQSGMYVCSTKCCPTNPRNGKGLKCNLNETVGDYVKKFSQRNNQEYVVRLVSVDNRRNRSQRANPFLQGNPREVPSPQYIMIL